MEIKTEHITAEDIKRRFLETERRLRSMELEKIDLIQSVRMVVKSTSLLLARRGYNNDLVQIFNKLETRLGEEPDSQAIFEEISQDIAKHNSKIYLAPLAPREETTATAQNDAKEETVLQEALYNLLEKIQNFKNERYSNISLAIKNLLDEKSSLESVMPLLVDLCVYFLTDYSLEISKISHRLNSIIRMLLFTEREYSKFLDASISNYDLREKQFKDTLTTGLGELEERCKDPQIVAEADNLLSHVTERIETLLYAVKLKNDEDAQLLDSLNKEKEQLSHRLDKVRRDYDSFVSQSHKTLLELETIKSVSLRDPLTKVYNRRAYDEQMALTLENYEKSRLSIFSLIIFDIDYFRDVNNNYGHLAGDGILAHVARLIKECLRCDDFIFRYGGDEFIVLLPEAKLADSIKVAEKFRRQVEVVDFKLSRNSPKTVNITISVGVTESCPGDTATSVLARADRALYVSKQAGRNRVSSI
ncbi:MAG: GGDEF domain-containing protein [Deltaproteobacteria bacterium]|jgi:diguanylate cyclase (GGDEF)-like protein|nr:GGDEF domain-containing protein [Deltaproteobacteria bacterium]